MLIAVPVEKRTLDEGVCPSFGRAPMYVVYNQDLLRVSYLDNPAATAQGGAGIKAAQFLTDHKVNVVIAPRLGQNAADVLLMAGVQIYQSVPEAVSSNLLKLEIHKLAPMTAFHAGFHGVSQ